MKISLDKQDFEMLIKGGATIHNGIEITLQDIGFQEMIDIIVKNYIDKRFKYFKNEKIGQK